MRRLLATCVLALLVFCAVAGAAFAKTPKPTVTSISPAQVPVGGMLVLKGKNFASGASHNRVFFSRATDGKTVRARPRKASKTRIEVVVPSGLTKFLVAGKATRFQVAVFTKLLGSKTSRSRSPIVFPAGATPTTPGTTPVAAPPPPPDCDADGTPDATDVDDDNDGLTDDLEAAIHTNSCNKDTDGDGVEDGYEYWAARDLNANAVPYPGKRPYPNALAADSDKDYDADGLTMSEEFQAWNLYGGRVLPAGDGQTFPYSDGNQASPAAGNAGGTDYDQNGTITDDEKDADGDGLANWVELAKGSTTASDKMSFGFFKDPNGSACPTVALTPRFQNCGAGTIPNGNTYTDGSFASYFVPNWLDPDSDGDGIPDGADDLDHDGISDLSEIAAATSPVNPCDPNTESRTCSQH